MAAPSSGEITMKGIHQEINLNDYANEIFDSNPISLSDLHDGTEGTINTSNVLADRPDGSAPHNMSKFYSYNHDKTYYFTFSNFAKRNGTQPPTTNYSAWDTGEYILHLKPSAGTTVSDTGNIQRCTTTHRVVTSGSNFTRAWCFVDVTVVGPPDGFVNGAAGSGSKYTFTNQEDTGGPDSAPRRTKQFFVDKVTDYVNSF